MEQGAAEGWPLEVQSFGKGGQFETAPWHTWAVDGGSPDYPIEVLEATMREIGRRMKLIEEDDWCVCVCGGGGGGGGLFVGGVVRGWVGG